MKDLHENALRTACRAVVQETLWQNPDPRSVRDIVDEDQIARTLEGYFFLARQEADCLAGHNLDPNIVTRAVLFLAEEYAISPMKDDLLWFGWTLNALVSLVIATRVTSRGSPAFLSDLKQMIPIHQRETA